MRRLAPLCGLLFLGTLAAAEDRLGLEEIAELIERHSDAEVTPARLGSRQLLLVRAPQEQHDPILQRRLQQRVSLIWEDLPLAEACDQLAKLANLPLVVEPGLRAAAGPMISLHVNNMSAARVLDWLRLQGRVHITPLHGGLYVSQDAPRRRQRIQIVDVGDLALPIRDFPGPDMGLASLGGRR